MLPWCPVRLVCLLVRSLGDVLTVARIALWSDRMAEAIFDLVFCICGCHQHVQNVLAPGWDLDKRNEPHPLSDLDDLESIEASSNDYISRQVGGKMPLDGCFKMVKVCLSGSYMQGDGKGPPRRVELM